MRRGVARQYLCTRALSKTMRSMERACTSGWIGQYTRVNASRARCTVKGRSIAAMVETTRAGTSRTGTTALGPSGGRANSRSHEGHWKDGKRHGIASYTIKLGQKRQGEFNYARRTGWLEGERPLSLHVGEFFSGKLAAAADSCVRCGAVFLIVLPIRVALLICKLTRSSWDGQRRF